MVYFVFPQVSDDLFPRLGATRNRYHGEQHEQGGRKAKAVSGIHYQGVGTH